MEKNIQRTLKRGERVSSTYAETYFDDEYCDHEIIRNKPPPPKISKRRKTIVSQFGFKDDWVSPSDLLIGIINLTPPFTSKITRGTTHEGILTIGNTVMVNERARFEGELRQLLRGNEAAWNNILIHEKKQVNLKVKEIYQKIFEIKSKTMAKEVALFYENSLQSLEDHLRDEIKQVLVSAHANIVSDLNTEIKEKLKNERTSLEKILEQRYNSEVYKIRIYYKILLENELYRYNKLLNKSLHERNDALNAFCKQIEAETITTTMYVMSIERKKCKIKQFFLDNYQTSEIKEKLQKIKEQQKVIDEYKLREHCVAEINVEWENKIKKVVQLFLKFISYTLKLLPEQSTFLFELEKMFVLELNEIQRQPKAAPQILVDEVKFQNVFSFEQANTPKPTCDKEPFVVVGDTADSIPPSYDSRETLPSDVDLPTIRLQRQFVYAKCHKYEAIKEFLESQRCKCMEGWQTTKTPSPVASSSIMEPEPPSKSVKSESSNELMLVDDIERIQHCPARNCQDWACHLSFPNLDAYLDFTERNFKTVKAILGTPPIMDKAPELTDPKHIAQRKIPFAVTTEPYHHAGTQYSSQEDVSILHSSVCSCVCGHLEQQDSQHVLRKESEGKLINELLMKRKISLRRMLQSNPKLLKMLTDESFDFQL